MCKNCRLLLYVEQSGFGINKIIEVYGKDVFKITDNFITVVLPFGNKRYCALSSASFRKLNRRLPI